MSKNLWLVFIAVILIAGGATLLFVWSPTPEKATPTPTPLAGIDPKNATYMIENQAVTLVNGESVASTATTKIFGDPVFGDLNGDGKTDAVIFLTQNSGGTGTFFYVAVALNNGINTLGTNAVFLGDRIAPQNISIDNGKITVNYADRKPTDPFSVQPSIGVSRYMTVQSSTLLAENAIVGAGGACGGNMTTAPTCQAGLHCAPNPGSHLPFGDVGGTCVAN